MTDTESANEEAAVDSSAPVRLVASIARGTMDEPQDGGGRLEVSTSEFNALVQRTEAMQDRIDTLEQRHQSGMVEDEEKVGLISQGNNNNGLDQTADGDDGSDDERPQRLSESQVEEMYDEYKMPESAYSLFITEDVISIPFFAGIVAATISLMCLALAYTNEIDNSSPGNPFGMPAGVRKEVMIAQYLGVIIGVLMEQEIPQGLELIGKGVEQDMTSRSRRFSMRRIVMASLLRIVIGYMFLICLFLVVVQEATVLDIFFDVLALQFVENIDDVIYELCKRGFFGRILRVATNNTHVIKGCKQSRTSRTWTKRIIRVVYIANMILICGMLTWVSQQQQMGKFRCESVSVNFYDAMWENAYVIGDDGEMTSKLLIFSHFNGIYVEDEYRDGRPRYVEMNKEDGDPFHYTTPAEIRYCEAIESWVFMHERIRTSKDSDSSKDATSENECSWLLRSPGTDLYDIIQLAEDSEWFVWKGLIETDYKVSIECNECDGDSDCNYNGNCQYDVDSDSDRCSCDEFHYGISCQFNLPVCDVIRSEKDSNTTLTLLSDPDDEEGIKFVESYNRPMYIVENMIGKPFGLMRLGYPDDDDQLFDIQYSNSTGSAKKVDSHKHYQPDFFTDDFFEINNQTEEFQSLLKNYTFVLRFTGQRWYGQLVPPGLSGASFKEEEYHSFWDNTFAGRGDEDNSTLIISAPTSDSLTPVGVDFYEMRRRSHTYETDEHHYNYGPHGVLVPLVDYEGSGFFHCNV